MSRILRSLTAAILLTASALAQSAVMRDSQAVALASAGWANMTAGTPIQDATLTGVATWTVGPDSQQVPATLKFKGSTEARLELALSSGPRVEIHTLDADAMPTGAWVDPTGVAHGLPLHNCWTDAAWFFPARLLAAAASQPNVGVRYIGQTTLYGTTVDHIAIAPTFSNTGSKKAALIQQLGTMDVYLDATTHLPVLLRYNTHPDNDFTVNIPVEIRLTDYRTVGAIRVPFSIEQRVSGNLRLKLTLNSAVFNSGLPDSDFQVTGGAQ